MTVVVTTVKAFAPYARNNKELEQGLQFNHLQILEFCVIYGEADECANCLPTLKASSTRVDVEELQERVELNLENMAVAADEELGRSLQELLTDVGIILAGVTTYVRHEDVCPLAIPTQLLRKQTSHIASVNIAMHGT